jgi:hypothetical protein
MSGRRQSARPIPSRLRIDSLFSAGSRFKGEAFVSTPKFPDRERHASFG